MEKKRRQYGAELKLKCVMEREAGKTFAQIARENRVPYTTVISWCKAGKDKILKERYDGSGTEKLPLIWRMPCRARQMSMT